MSGKLITLPGTPDDLKAEQLEIAQEFVKRIESEGFAAIMVIGLHSDGRAEFDGTIDQVGDMLVCAEHMRDVALDELRALALEDDE